MRPTLEFFFDFSSPYAYFASLQVEDVAARTGVACAWKPILLGPAFKASGNSLLIEQPLKGAYSRHDWDRMARLMGVAYAFPDPFPLGTQLAARIFYWLDSQDPGQAKAFAKSVFAAYFGQGLNVSTPDVLRGLLDGLERDAQAGLDAAQDPRWKTHLRQETEGAIGRGLFGAPFFFVGDEGFWGADRLPMVEKWLESGGW